MNPAALALIAHPTRAAILRETWSVERAAGEIAEKFSVTFGAVSQHLKLLLDAGLLRLRRDGRRRLYQADRAALGPLAAALEAMWATQLLVLKEKAEAAEAATRGRKAAPPREIYASKSTTQRKTRRATRPATRLPHVTQPIEPPQKPPGKRSE